MTTNTEQKKWEASDTDVPGPVQVSRFNKAWSALAHLHNYFVEITGFEGDPQSESRTVLWSMFGVGHNEHVAEAQGKLGERFGWTVSRSNAAEATKAVQAEVDRIHGDPTLLPEKDSRVSREEKAERDENAARMAEEATERDKAREESFAAISAKLGGAQAVIVAEEHENQSDPMTDYFAHSTARTVAIGLRFSKREDFRALRAAAATFPETAHLGPEADGEIEHRENYSMGAGNYLKAGGSHSSGWAVKSVPVGYLKTHCPMEDRIPESSQNAMVGEPVEGVSVTINDVKGGVEIRFPDKPSEEIRDALKAAKFRWSRGSRCWYRKNTPGTLETANEIVGNEVEAEAVGAGEDQDGVIDG